MIKSKSLEKKIDLWYSDCKEINIAAFPTLKNVVIDKKLKVIRSDVKDITIFLSDLNINAMLIFWNICLTLIGFEILSVLIT